ncbi:MAG: hypothetical protein IJD20_03525 [Oscillospiraceae bacterium]|nr:hypothetical protein [Oscillospiraceae bacterium]
MSIERYYQTCSLTCDYCGKQLSLERPDDAAKARRAAGWEVRTCDGEMLDICDDCIFEEKGYEDNE